MNIVEDYMHQKIMEYWESFPFKLDYIVYLLCKHTNNIEEFNNIQFQFQVVDKVYIPTFLGNKNNFYRAISSLSEKHEIRYEYLKITEDELIEYFNKINANFKKSFMYYSEIFDNPLRLHFHNLTVVNNGKKCFYLRLDFDEYFEEFKEIFDANQINDALNQYSLAYKINEASPDKNTISEKKSKL